MSSTKRIAREIFLSTLSSINIPLVMQRKLQLEHDYLILPGSAINIANISRFVVIAMGKAAHAMVEGLIPLLPPGSTYAGVVAAPTRPQTPVSGIEYFICGHPIPNEDSLRAAQAVLRLLSSCDSHALVFFLLSGGGSALVELPLDPSLTLTDVQAIHRALVTCGAPIDAINTVRRHVSAVKGGRLALAAAAAQKVTLAVTDVPFGKEAALASGPTLPDPTTVADVVRIFEQHNLPRHFPASLQRWLSAGHMPETPKADDPAFANSHFELLLGLDDLFHAAHHAVEAHGYVCFCDNSTDDWPVQKAADYLLAQLEGWQRDNPDRRVAIVVDGEVSSPVTGNGIGGRNSAFVLACVERIAGKKITVLSAGTDGIDGNSSAAGAVADGDTLKRATALRLDPKTAFRESDAYTFFARLDDAISTGPTGNNLRDLRLLLAGPSREEKRHPPDLRKYHSM
jgi:glycerate 2-kinase